MNVEEIKQRLAVLRQKWKDNPDKRYSYELQGRALRIALEMYYKKHPKEHPVQY